MSDKEVTVEHKEFTIEALTYLKEYQSVIPSYVTDLLSDALVRLYSVNLHEYDTNFTLIDTWLDGRNSLTPEMLADLLDVKI